MADIHIRKVSDELYRAVKVKAATAGITLKAYLMPFLEMAAQSNPLPVDEGVRVHRTQKK